MNAAGLIGPLNRPGAASVDQRAPKDDVDRNTYGLFDLEGGVSTDAYPLEEAVRDGFLVLSRAVSVPLKFQREGITYSELSEEDKEQWDALDWDEEGGVPDRVEAEAVNWWLFNKDTVDKVLEHLMTRGLAVASGDRLGKTIIFAKNQQHAEFIAERFDANYPHLKGAFARIITFKTEYAQSLIDGFAIREKAPHIAVSVDMLDTGIDVPEVVNLVFFELVRSNTKFGRMLGRGTRLWPDLFGSGQHKKYFYVFDYCQNPEYFAQDIPGTGGSTVASLAKLPMNRALTPSDIAELERLLEEHGAGAVDDSRRAVQDAQGLGLLVRSPVGMDQAAAKEALPRFTRGKTLSANQLAFVNPIVDHLTEPGVTDPGRLYESPFTDVTPRGPEGLFASGETDELSRALHEVWESATAA